MTNLTAYERVIDLTGGRTRVTARQSRAFIFAARAMMEGRPVNQSLDGNVAYDTAPDGATRRVSAEAAARRRMELPPIPSSPSARARLPQPARKPAHRGATTLLDVTTAGRRSSRSPSDRRPIVQRGCAG
jgi:hypothetical protein